jgi:hypothetical protein
MSCVLRRAGLPVGFAREPILIRFLVCHILETREGRQGGIEGNISLNSRSCVDAEVCGCSQCGAARLVILVECELDET